MVLAAGGNLHSAPGALRKRTLSKGQPPASSANVSSKMTLPFCPSQATAAWTHETNKITTNKMRMALPRRIHVDVLFTIHVTKILSWQSGAIASVASALESCATTSQKFGTLRRHVWIAHAGK